MGTLAERVEIADELFELAGRSADPVVAVEAGLAVYYASVANADVDRARTELAVAERGADEIGQPALRLRVAVAQQNCAVLDGRWADYTRYSAQALHLGESLGRADRFVNHVVDTAIARLLQGRVAETIDDLEKICVTQPVGPRVAYLTWPYTELGRLAEARGQIAAVGGSALSHPLNGYGVMYFLAALAPASVELGDVELAAALYERLLPHRDEVVLGQVTALGPVAHFLGVLAAALGRFDDADEHFAAAVAFAARTGARGLVTRTHLEWAGSLLARGEVARGREQAAAAQDAAAELDLPALADRATVLLAGLPEHGS
jgi:tetratricopeptide (TPR) repeat protein